MIAGNYQVVDILMLVGSIGPIALYFLILGMVNSHSRPHLITSRSDFILLTIVLGPLLLLPVPSFIQSGTWLPLVIGLIIAGSIFTWILPQREAGFVIYNISEARCTRVLTEVLMEMGLAGRWRDDTWTYVDGRTTIHVKGFTLLRNVTLHIENHGGEFPHIQKLGEQLRRRLDAISQLPSTTGISLVVVGVCMMIVPMWMLTRHIDDIVDAMNSILW